MSEERRSPQDGTKWMSGAPLWDSYVADLAARTTIPSSSLSAPAPTSTGSSGGQTNRYFLPWNFNPAAAAAVSAASALNSNLSANCAGASGASNLWNAGAAGVVNPAAFSSPPNRHLSSIGFGVPTAFSGGGPGFFPQDKMLNEFLTRPPPIHGCPESAAPRPSSASVLGEKLAAEALNALNFNLNLNMNGVHCGPADQIPTTSAPSSLARVSEDSLPLDKAHLLRGILQGCNRAMPEGMDIIAEPLIRDFSGKDNNNMVMKSGRPDLIGRLLGAGKRSRRESAAPPVRDRRTIKRPRPDSIIIRSMQEKYEMEKASLAIQQPGQLLAPVKDLPPPPPLRPAPSTKAIGRRENGEIHHSDKGSDNEIEDKRPSDVDENSNGPVHGASGDDAEDVGNDDDIAECAAAESADSNDGELNGDGTMDDGDDVLADGDDIDGSQPPASPAGSTGSVADAKKARVENIVSGMRASPVMGHQTSGAVNGCKKRKLYQPQQHSGDEDAGSNVPVKLTRTDNDVADPHVSAVEDDTADDSQDEGEQMDMSKSDSNGELDASHFMRQKLSIPPYSAPTESNRARGSPEPAPLREKSNILTPADLADLGETLKLEMFASLACIVDSIVSRYTGIPANPGRSNRLLAQLSRNSGNNNAHSAESDPGRRSPRPTGNKMLGRTSSMHFATSTPATTATTTTTSSNMPVRPSSANSHPNASSASASENNVNVLNLARMQSTLFQKSQFSGGYHHGASAASAANPLNLSAQPAAWHSPHSPREVPEQKEALSLVVTPRKKRQKITDSRAGARPFGRYLGSGSDQEHSPKTEFMSDSPSPREASVPTSLATPMGLPNAAALHPDILSSYSAAAAAAFYGNALSGRGPHLGHHGNDLDSPPASLLHPAALLNAAHQAASPDLFGYGDGGSTDSPVTELTYDGYRPTISFSKQSGTRCLPTARGRNSYEFDETQNFVLNSLPHSSTLTPMHLRKAKLMFFWVRYPSSAILKTYFPDINFNKNNTAQLVKWFSNFREFYYIQMEKYARQALAEGIESPEDIHVNPESCELLRILNLHYNRNNHIDMPTSFSYVVEQTMREFFKAVKDGKDNEPTWKKTIYKIIARLDDSVPEYFKSQSFLEQLE